MVSVDALRGFAMFWLVGGQAVVLALAAYLGWPRLVEYLERELEHPPWHGFHWWDLVMPLFIFVSGVTIPLVITRRLERGDGKLGMYWRVFRRLVALMVLNLIAYGALDHYHWWEMRFVGVLARIGLAYFFAAIIVMNARPRGQFAWALGILIGYWAAMVAIPVPGVGRGLFTQEGNLAAFMDRNLLPGILFGGMYDRLGLYSTIPTISTVLIGALAGHWLFLGSQRPAKKVLGLLVAGAVLWAAGQLGNFAFPFNTKVWSPTYVLVAGGWSLILLALFYQVIDVWGLRRWAFFFVVIGLNSITIYFVTKTIGFDGIAHYLFDGAIQYARPDVRPVLWACSVLAVGWFFVLFLYRRRIFVRV